MQPRIPLEEINRVKNQLREFTDRVNKGETSLLLWLVFILRIRVQPVWVARWIISVEVCWIPAFANVAFNLPILRKISKIVESEFGYHIIQLIDKRGDKIKCRHILLKPQVSQDAIDKSIGRLDSIGNDIRAAKFTFEQAVEALSDDKDTRNNKGLMANVTPDQSRTSPKLPDEGSTYRGCPYGRYNEGR